MATAAQIEANRRNAQRNTGPKTDEGKDRVRRNAFKHGMTARTIMPVLPQEDPKELEDQIQQAITAMKPRNPLELDLVCRAVRLAGELDRAERVATAHLAHRVRMATRSGTDTVSAEELSRVHDLGSKLFFQAAIGPGYSDSIADDYPAVIVRRLEESAEGCRWLLARWAEILNLLDREAAWGDPEFVRFVGLLGKRGIEAHFDPELNSLFHAFDALGNRIGHKFWNERSDHLPLGYVGGFEFVTYREIAPPPSDKNAALILICSVIERHVGRPEELLAEHEQIEAAEAAERYDRAALDCSPAFERHRRYQSARHRELLQTLEALRKMRKEEFGTGNEEAEKADDREQMADDREQMADDREQMADDREQMADDREQMADDREQMADDREQMADDREQMADDREQMADDREQMADDREQMADDREQMADDREQMADDGCRMAAAGCEVRSGGCGDGQDGETTPEVSQGRIVGHDSQRVTEDATDDEIGILSHEGTHAAGQPGQGDGVGQCLPDDMTTPQKAPNKANLESKQSLKSQELKSEITGAEGWKQSQSSQGETRTKPGSRDGRPARQSGRRPVGREAQGSELLRVAGFLPLGRSGDLESPGDGQMKSRTYRVTLTDLTESSAFRTKEDLQWAAQFIALNSELLGEVDPELLAKIDEMADESDL